MRGISWLAANQLASQEGLCTMEWVSKEHNLFWKLKTCGMLRRVVWSIVTEMSKYHNAFVFRLDQFNINTKNLRHVDNYWPEQMQQHSGLLSSATPLREPQISPDFFFSWGQWALDENFWTTLRGQKWVIWTVGMTMQETATSLSALKFSVA